MLRELRGNGRRRRAAAPARAAFSPGLIRTRERRFFPSAICHAEEAGNADHQLTHPLDQRERERHLGAEADHPAEKHQHALLHAKRARHEERGGSRRQDKALEQQGIGDAHLVAHEVERDVDLGRAQHPGGELAGRVPRQQPAVTVEIEDCVVERLGAADGVVPRPAPGKARHEADDPAEQATLLKNAQQNDDHEAARNAEADGPRDIALAVVGHQQADADQGEEQQGDGAEGEVDDDARTRDPPRHAAHVHEPGADHRATDLKRRHQRIDRLPDPARPERRQHRGPVAFQEEQPPDIAVEHDRHEAHQDDHGDAPAHRGDGSRHIAGALIADEPDDERDTRDESDVAPALHRRFLLPPRARETPGEAGRRPIIPAGPRIDPSIDRSGRLARIAAWEASPRRR